MPDWTCTIVPTSRVAKSMLPQDYKSESTYMWLKRTSVDVCCKEFCNSGSLCNSGPMIVLRVLNVLNVQMFNLRNFLVTWL